MPEVQDVTIHTAASNSITTTWYQWNAVASTTTTTTVTNDQLWTGWITGTTIAATAINVRQVQPGWSAQPTVYPERTAEEWAAIRADQERQREERAQRRSAAQGRARKLLRFVLTPEQFESYVAHNWFYVTGSEGGLYKVRHGTSGNISRVIDGTEVNALCAHPRLYDPDSEDYLPVEDCVAAQALALMHDERGFVTLANVHRGQRYLAAVPDRVAA